MGIKCFMPVLYTQFETILLMSPFLSLNPSQIKTKIIITSTTAQIGEKNKINQKIVSWIVLYVITHTLTFANSCDHFLRNALQLNFCLKHIDSQH